MIIIIIRRLARARRMAYCEAGPSHLREVVADVITTPYYAWLSLRADGMGLHMADLQHRPVLCLSPSFTRPSV